MVTLEIETDRATFVGGDRHEIAPWLEYRAAAAQIIGAQGDVLDVRLHVDDHPGTVAVVLAGHDHFLPADGHGAFEVQAAGEVVVEGRTLDEAVAIDQVRTHGRHGIQADAIGIGDGRGGDALQHMVLQGFAIGDRGIVIAPAFPRGAGANAAGNLFTGTAQRDIHTQVDAAIAVVSRTHAARPIEQRQAPIGVTAKQLSALAPAQVHARAVDVAFTVGHPGVD
ncbi:hypothetical protein D3C76_1173590 [compost metagenome]